MTLMVFLYYTSSVDNLKKIIQHVLKNKTNTYWTAPIYTFFKGNLLWITVCENNQNKKMIAIIDSIILYHTVLFYL